MEHNYTERDRTLAYLQVKESAAKIAACTYPEDLTRMSFLMGELVVLINRAYLVNAEIDGR